jgi:hypothetical protein
MKFSSTKGEGYGIICTNVHNSDLNGQSKHRASHKGLSLCCRGGSHTSAFSRGRDTSVFSWGRDTRVRSLEGGATWGAWALRVFPNLRRMHEYWNLPLHVKQLSFHWALPPQRQGLILHWIQLLEVFTLLEPVSHQVNQFLWWKCLDRFDWNGLFRCLECGHSR